MRCPICKISDLVIKSDNYFCPDCQIFIGSAKKDVLDFKADSASRWESSAQVQIPTPKAEFITFPQPKEASSTMRNLLIGGTALILLFGFYLLFTKII